MQGVLEEVRLISWPTPLQVFCYDFLIKSLDTTPGYALREKANFVLFVQALNDTVSVVALVALLAVALFGLNTGFNEASKQYYNFAKATFPKLN